MQKKYLGETALNILVDKIKKNSLGVVFYDQSQELTIEQKAQARENIGVTDPIQSDMNQTDPEAAGFVKNNPIEDGVVELVFDGTLDGKEYKEFTMDGMTGYLVRMTKDVPAIDDLVSVTADIGIGIETGEVTKNLIEIYDTHYVIAYCVFVALEDGADGLGIGEENFAINKGVWFMLLDTSVMGGTGWQGGLGLTYKGKQLKPSLLPSHSHKWDDIEDKPFYHNETWVEILSRENARFDIDGSSYFNYVEGCYVNPGDVLKVVWDGTEYECVVIEPDTKGETSITNAAAFGGFNEGYPFVGANYSTPEGSVLIMGSDDPFVSNDIVTHTHSYSISKKQVSIKELDPKFYSWKNMKDKPFGETMTEAPLNITFDGDMTGKESLMMEEGMYLVKVSDAVLSMNDLIGSTMVSTDGTNEASFTVTSDYVIDGSSEGIPVYAAQYEDSESGLVFIAYCMQSDFSMGGITLTTGIWLLCVSDGTNSYMWIKSLSNPNVMAGKTEIKKLDPKFYDRPCYENYQVIWSVENAEFVISDESDVTSFTQYLINTLLDIESGNTYIVNWDNVDYECKASAYPEGVVVLGNKYPLGFNDEDDTGEPFLIVLNPSEGTGVIDIETVKNTVTESTYHTFSISTKEIKKLDNKFIDAEWMAKSKLISELTFDGNSFGKTVVEDTMVKISDRFFTAEELAGCKFTLVNNGISTVYDATIGDFESTYGRVDVKSDLTYARSYKEGNSNGYEQGTYVICSVDGSIYLSAITLAEPVAELTPLPEKFIPDTIARKSDLIGSNAEWQATSEIKDVEVIPETTYIYTADGSSEYCDLSPYIENIDVTRPITVTWNNEDYTCEIIPFFDASVYVAGNSTIANLNIDGGNENAPFFLVLSISENKFVIYAAQTGEVIFSAIQNKEVCNILPEKFLPNHIQKIPYILKTAIPTDHGSTYIGCGGNEEELHEAYIALNKGRRVYGTFGGDEVELLNIDLDEIDGWHTLHFKYVNGFHEVIVKYYGTADRYTDNRALIQPSTASIGQTITVKAIDDYGIPTEWEAVDLPSIEGLATETYVVEQTTALKNDILNGAGAAYDTLKELGDLIDENTNALDALNTVAINKQDKITGTAGQFVVIGDDGNLIAVTIPSATGVSF